MASEALVTPPPPPPLSLSLIASPPPPPHPHPPPLSSRLLFLQSHSRSLAARTLCHEGRDTAGLCRSSPAPSQGQPLSSLREEGREKQKQMEEAGGVERRRRRRMENGGWRC
eukprot:763814-Hanusia_phi.AAC.2